MLGPFSANSFADIHGRMLHYPVQRGLPFPSVHVGSDDHCHTDRQTFRAADFSF